MMSHKLRKTILASATLLALVAVTVFVIVPVLKRHTLDVAVDRSHFPVKGIDVSHHNGDIDFGKVKADSIDFVIIKATDGVGDTDSNLGENYTRAKTAGLDVGVYHFFRYSRSGDEQADYLLGVIDTLQLDLPVTIDIEDAGNDAGSRDEVSNQLRVMVERLHRAGYRVMIYANRQQYSSYIRNRFDDVDLWLASSTPPADDDLRRLWQHSHCGHVDGIGGDVDLNTFNGSRDQYRSWLDKPSNAR